MKPTEPCYILIDGDMVAFRLASAAYSECHWDERIISAYVDLEALKVSFKDAIDDIVSTATKTFRVRKSHPVKPILCLSDVTNWRKSVLETYKANRKSGCKPLGYWSLIDWVKENFECKYQDTLEADDIVGILATTVPYSIMVSGDKDFKTIPGRLYDWLSGKHYTTTLKDANRFHLYQTLIGDTADNYKGCPGMGPVSANRLLDKDPSWAAVVNAFKAKGLTEEDCLIQARIARILRATEWDTKDSKIIPWEPSHDYPSISN